MKAVTRGCWPLLPTCLDLGRTEIGPWDHPSCRCRRLLPGGARQGHMGGAELGIYSDTPSSGLDPSLV